MNYHDYSKIRDAFVAQKINSNPGARFGIMFKLKCDLKRLTDKDGYANEFASIKELRRDMEKELNKAEAEMEGLT